MNPGRTAKYPIATIIPYGPDNTRAIKLAVAIFDKPGQKEPTQLHRWFCQVGEIRNDPAIGQEIAEFLKAHGVRETVASDRILGCPHEEGIDYPEGGVCPHCPFWATVDRFTHKTKSDLPDEPQEAPVKIGRNDPCPCGSGKKYKKCCGAKGA